MAKLPYPKLYPQQTKNVGHSTTLAAQKKPLPKYGSLTDTEKSYTDSYFAASPDYARTRRNRLAGRLDKSAYYSQIDPQTLWDYFGAYVGEVDDAVEAEDFFDPYGEDESVYVPHENYQFSLPLETVEDLERRHRQAIQQYQRATERMGVSAMLWEQLMEDLEDNPSAQQQFNDLIMILNLYR